MRALPLAMNPHLTWSHTADSSRQSLAVYVERADSHITLIEEEKALRAGTPAHIII